MDLNIKPQWFCVPTWAKFIAQNKTGDWFAYSQQPLPGSEQWVPHSRDHFIPYQLFFAWGNWPDNQDWERSLEARPEVIETLSNIKKNEYVISAHGQALIVIAVNRGSQFAVGDSYHTTYIGTPEYQNLPFSFHRKESGILNGTQTGNNGSIAKQMTIISKITKEQYTYIKSLDSQR